VPILRAIERIYGIELQKFQKLTDKRLFGFPRLIKNEVVIDDELE
jgi:hypothetical protein